MTAAAAPVARVTDLFKQRFGRAPDVVASAPGRVNLIGEHTDYNGGDVLPIAIGQRTYVAAARSSLGRSRVRSLSAGAEGIFDALVAERTGDWWDYVAGVAWAFARAGVELPQCDFVIASDVPQGAGLSSSASLEVAVAAAVNALSDAAFDDARLARLAHEAEREFVGVACGIMDQFVCALAREGSALLIHCDSGATEDVPIGDHVLILDTNVRRDLRAGDYNTRQRECATALAWMRAAGVTTPNLAHAPPDVLQRVPFGEPLGSRVRHVLEEQARVADVVGALRATGHIPGPALNASHESLRTLYECSCPELDWLVTAVSAQPGVAGARLTGAGWGGCAIAVGEDADALQHAAERMQADYAGRFGRAAQAWLTYARGGVELQRL